MAYVHITTSEAQTIEDFNGLNAKLRADGPIDGLLFQAAGSTDEGLRIVSVFESEAHHDRFEAERLFPLFAASGMPVDAQPPGTTFITFETEYLGPTT